MNNASKCTFGILERCYGASMLLNLRPPYMSAYAQYLHRKLHASVTSNITCGKCRKLYSMFLVVTFPNILLFI